MAQLLVAKSGLTPLFHTLRLKRGFWTGSIKTVFDRVAADTSAVAGEAGHEVPEADAFETVDFDASS
jgi:hypothetical protein